MNETTVREAEPERAGRGRLLVEGSKGYTALAWANISLLLTVLFFSGMFYQRVLDLEARVTRMQSTEVLTAQIEDLRSEVTRLRDRLDRLIDQESRTGRPASLR